MNEYADFDDHIITQAIARRFIKGAYDQDCPFCGQEIPADDFAWDGEGYSTMCFRCEKEVMQ